jgi:hypothetical protein
VKRKVRLKVVEITRQTSALPQIVTIYCSKCEAEAEIVTRIEAAAILQAADLELEHLILSGGIHAQTTVNGAVWICKKSLFRGKEVES